MGFSVDSDWNWSYKAFGDSFSNDMLIYKNTSSTDQILESVYFYMGTGNGTFTGGTTVTGSGQTYSVYATCVGSDGVTKTSSIKSISNAVSSSYSGVAKTTFTLNVYVAAGASVTIRLHFSESASGYPVAIVHGRSNSSYWGGTYTEAGSVRIRVGNEWKKATPYVYKDGAWHKCIPYVYKDGWQRCT